MFKTRLLLGLLGLLAAAFPGVTQVNRVPRASDINLENLQQAKFIPASGSTRDAVTGLPTRIVHKAGGLVLVLVPTGEFMMGSAADEPERETNERRHRRIIRRPFYLGETEVTVAQFRGYIRATGYQTDAERGVPESGHGKGAFATTPDGDRQWNAVASWYNPFPNLKNYRPSDNHPVVQISWHDAVRFVEHYGLRLPTEAQWEYAARAGSRTRFFWGDEISGGRGYGNVKDASGRRQFPGWNSSFPFDDGVALLSAVGSYRPNAWKIFDMVGNVSEWCQDSYLGKYPDDGSDESAVSSESSSAYVMRGGSWLDEPDASRSAKRLAFPPQGRRDFVGFRVAATIEIFK
jgi:formylglycine-generating enzyme required for sulfatase activity